jgi:antitoxin component of MazEF toxin-antitoxin module
MPLERDTELDLSQHQIGNSRGYVIPKHWRDRLELDPDELVDAEIDLDDRTITFHF